MAVATAQEEVMGATVRDVAVMEHKEEDRGKTPFQGRIGRIRKLTGCQGLRWGEI